MKNCIPETMGFYKFFRKARTSMMKNLNDFEKNLYIMQCENTKKPAGFKIHLLVYYVNQILNTIFCYLYHSKIKIPLFHLVYSSNLCDLILSTNLDGQERCIMAFPEYTGRPTQARHLKHSFMNKSTEKFISVSERIKLKKNIYFLNR